VISKDLEVVLGEALAEALRRRHEYLCAEHVLYALAENEQGKTILVNCGVDVEALRRDLESFFTTELEQAPEGIDVVVEQTVAFERLMRRALTHVHFSGKEEVDAGDLLAAMLEEKESYAAYFMETQGATRLDVLNFISHGISKIEYSGETPADSSAAASSTESV